MVTVAQRVNNMITDHGGTLCDRCIAMHLGMKQAPQAQLITQALGTTRDFIREEGLCTLCNGQRMVIRRA